MMTVIGTVDEINAVLRHFNPKYPMQRMEIIKTNECFYSLNGVGVKVILVEEEENDGG